MKKEQFIVRFLPHAERAAQASGVPALFALAQSALETGWGKKIEGNMMFGMKVGSGKPYGGWTGMQQLVTTHEYGSHDRLTFPYIFNGYPIQQPNGQWKYKIKDLFRAYPSPEASFRDWGGLLSNQARYRAAFQNRGDPFLFAEAIAQAGYATDPHYAQKIQRLMQTIAQVAKQWELWKNPKALVIPAIVLGLGAITLFLAYKFN